MKYTLSLLVSMISIWLLWSGHYTPLLISLGVLSSILVVVLARRMDLVDQEGVLVDIALRLPFYVIWLIWEITKANVEVARRILDPRLPISPRMVRVKADQRHDLSRVIYANSITLTPGTVSVDTEGDVIIVHALTKPAADEVETGSMGRQVKRLEGSE